MKKSKTEASTVSSVVTKDAQALQGFGGSHFDPSFRTKGADSPVQRHRKKKPSRKPLKHRSFDEAQSFERGVVGHLLGINETVRKKGNVWVLFDDDTGVQTGSYKSRKAAWDAQRIRRAQSKYRHKKRKSHKDKAPVQHARTKTKTKAQVGQTASTPKVAKVKGIKPIKPISPLKPIRPKGLAGRAASREAFDHRVASDILRSKNNERGIV